MVRAPCCEKTGLKKGPWAHEEDQILISYIKKNGHGNWRALPKQAGLLRCGKSCRLRWMNYLSPDIKRGNFTKEEEDNIIHLHEILGNRWSAIATRLPGRTDNEIKNVWHTNLKKRLKNHQSPHNSKSHSRRSINQINSSMCASDSPQISSSETSVMTSSSSSIATFDTMINDQIVVKSEEIDLSEYFTKIDENFWTDELTTENNFNFVTTMDGEEFQSLDMFNSNTTIMEDDMDFLFNIFIKAEDFSELPQL